MQMHLLVTQEMLDKFPKEVKLMANWEEVALVPPDISIQKLAKKLNEGKKLFPNDVPYYKGDHIAIEGEPQAVVNWLSKFNGFWLGEGSPMMQRFTWKTSDMLIPATATT